MTSPEWVQKYMGPGNPEINNDATVSELIDVNEDSVCLLQADIAELSRRINNTTNPPPIPSKHRYLIPISGI